MKKLLFIFLFLLSLFSQSQVIFQKTIGDLGGDDYGNSILQTNDGGYIIAGTTQGAIDANVCLIKTDRFCVISKFFLKIFIYYFTI